MSQIVGLESTGYTLAGDHNIRSLTSFIKADYYRLDRERPILEDPVVIALHTHITGYFGTLKVSMAPSIIEYGLKVVPGFPLQFLPRFTVVINTIKDFEHFPA